MLSFNLKSWLELVKSVIILANVGQTGFYFLPVSPGARERIRHSGSPRFTRLLVSEIRPSLPQQKHRRAPSQTHSYVLKPKDSATAAGTSGQKIIPQLREHNATRSNPPV